MELLQFLNTLPAFQTFTPAYVGVLAGLMKVGQFPGGHVFIEQGQQGEPPEELGRERHGDCARAAGPRGARRRATSR